MYESGFARVMSLSPKLRRSGHTVRRHARDSLLVHMHETSRQLRPESQTTLASYISDRPCDLTGGLCNHSPVTKMLSLEGVTLIYSSTHKINVTQDWSLQMPPGEYRSRGPNNWHAEEKSSVCKSHVSLCRRQLCCLLTNSERSQFTEMCLWPGGRACRQTCDSTEPRRRGAFRCQGDKLDSRFPLCLWAVRCSPLSQFSQLLSKAPEIKTGGWKSEARGRRKRNLRM